MEPTADASSADILAWIRLGIAMPAMINMMVMTISNSIKVNPRFFRIRPSCFRERSG
jgi:hypothetical protein